MGKDRPLIQQTLMREFIFLSRFWSEYALRCSVSDTIKLDCSTWTGTPPMNDSNQQDSIISEVCLTVSQGQMFEALLPPTRQLSKTPPLTLIVNQGLGICERKMWFRNKFTISNSLNDPECILAVEADVSVCVVCVFCFLACLELGSDNAVYVCIFSSFCRLWYRTGRKKRLN